MTPYYALCSVIAIALVNQVFGGEPPSYVDTLYKQLQDDGQSLAKLYKDSAFYVKEWDDEKYTGPIKNYLLKTNEVIYDSAKKLEKDVKPYYSEDIHKQIVAIQKQVEEVSKILKKKEYYENLEKLHETYQEGLKKLQEQLYEVAKTSPLKEHIPEKIQAKIKEFFESYVALSKKTHAQINDYLLSLKKRL